MLLHVLEKAVIKAFDHVSDAVYRLRRHYRRDSTEPQHIVLGTAPQPFHPNRIEKISLDQEQRLRHIYSLGGTGSGKTKVIESLARQDITHQNGFSLADPHGDLSENILRFLAIIIEQARNAGDQALIDSIMRRLILVEPFNPEWSVAFNPLECGNKASSYQQALEMMGVFRRLWGDGNWGPRMDELLRNTLVTLSENDLTLLEVRPLLTDTAFRHRLVQNLRHSETRDYWLYRYNRLSERMQAMYREPVVNRVSIFTSDPHIRHMVGQSHSTLDFRRAMDEGKWVLLNLSKGHLKENAALLGSLLICKAKLAAMSRADVREEVRRPHTIYADEFQTFVGDDFETILSESRKYKLALVVAHQTLAQLTPQLRSAIFGNVATKVIFRVSAHDAATVAAELGGKDKTLERKLTELGVREAYLKIKEQRPVLLKTLYVPPMQVQEDSVAALRTLCYRAHARRREEIEREIQDRKETLMTRLISSAEAGGVNDEQQRRSRAYESAIANSTTKGSEEGQTSW